MKVFVVLLSLICSLSSFGKETIFIARVPGEYIGKTKTKFYLSAIIVENDLIKKVTEVSVDEITSYKDAIHLKVSGHYAGIYPGLIDLHNHPKQSLLPLWEHAHGQFGNRHEWRGWSVYSHSLGGNMNPWSGNGKVEVCAAFRWAELQAAVLGTTLMQGPRYCTNDFSISHVEGGDGFYNDKTNAAGEFVPKETNVQAPTDLFQPEDMTYIYKVIRPLKTEGKTFHDALELSLEKTCSSAINEIKVLSKQENDNDQLDYLKRLDIYQKSPTFSKFHSLEVAKTRLNTPYLFTKSAIKYLSDKNNLTKNCLGNRGDDFDLYFTDYHGSIVNKILLLQNPNSSGIIAHLSEGRRNDPYNKVEFEIAKTLGLIVPGMSLVHAVGLNKSDLKFLKKQDVGIVWSPFSNLLLYGETVLIEEAIKLGINVALGSDWTPTGSKSVLEEVKIAKRYALKFKIDDVLTDEVLFKMMSENPARMIRKFEKSENDGRHGVGSVKADGMASFIAIEIKNENPYTNIVEATENEISLVVSNGDVIYGNIDLLNLLGVPSSRQDWVPVQYELDENSSNLAGEYEDVSNYLTRSEFQNVTAKKLTVFDQPKAFVVTNKEDNSELLAFKESSSLDLERPSDIQKVLHILLTTQSRNVHNEKENYLVETLPPLVSIADKNYLKRFDAFIKSNGQEDEVERNYVYRLEWRRQVQDERDSYNENNPHIPGRYSIPYRLANAYGVDYDLELGVVGY